MVFSRTSVILREQVWVSFEVQKTATRGTCGWPRWQFGLGAVSNRPVVNSQMNGYYLLPRLLGSPWLGGYVVSNNSLVNAEVAHVTFVLGELVARRPGPQRY